MTVVMPERLEELVPAVESLSRAEASVVFHSWWARWRPLFAMIYSNDQQLSSVLSTLSLLDGEWKALDDDASSRSKIAIRENARFLRSFDPESPIASRNACSEIAWANTDLVKDLYIARAEAHVTRALSSIVRLLPQTITAIAFALRPSTINMSIDDLLGIVRQYETPEVEWFRAVIRAALRREDLTSLREAPVAVEPLVAELAAKADRD